MIQNVPDVLAMYIPKVHLTSLTTVDMSLINEKSWSHSQVRHSASILHISWVSFLSILCDDVFCSLHQAEILFGAVAHASGNVEE